MPKISQHSCDIAVVAVRPDHTSGVSVLKVYRPWARQIIKGLTDISHSVNRLAHL